MGLHISHRAIDAGIFTVGSINKGYEVVLHMGIR